MHQIILIGVVALFGVCNSQNNPLPDTTKWTPFVCRAKGVYTPNDDRMAGVAACKTKTDQCSTLCEASALGLVHADGTLTAETFEKWVMVVLPEEYKTFAVAFFKDCFTKYGQNTIPANTDCKKAKEFSKCTWGIVPELKCVAA